MLLSGLKFNVSFETHALSDNEQLFGQCFLSLGMEIIFSYSNALLMARSTARTNIVPEL
jgi:hypothetical protein